MILKEVNCPVCGSQNILAVIEFTDVHVHSQAPTRGELAGTTNRWVQARMTCRQPASRRVEEVCFLGPEQFSKVAESLPCSAGGGFARDRQKASKVVLGAGSVCLEQFGEMSCTAAQLRASLDAHQIETVSGDAREANDLIDRRTFSWTALFNRFETTLPDDVRITAVRPSLDREHRIVLTVTVLAKSVSDITEFMSRLDETGVFRDLFSTQERPNEDNQIESILQMVYTPEHAHP